MAAVGPRLAPREIAPGVFWLFACEIQVNNGRVDHSYKSAYVVRGSRAAAILDTGHPKQWPAIQRQLRQVLGDRPLDYVVPTHPEYVHAGNLPRLLDAFPQAVAVAKGTQSGFHLQFPEYAHRLVSRVPGESLDLGDRSLLVLRPLIYDLPGTLWAYDPTTRVLFAADGLAHHHHSPDCCGLTSGELAEAGCLPTVENFAEYNDGAFYWTKYVDMHRTFRQLEALFASHPVDVVAPAHGTVVTDWGAVAALAEEGMSQGALVP